MRYGQLRAHDRVLDFRAGTLTRTAEWCSPARRTRARDVDAARVVHPSRDPRHRLRGRAARRARQRRRAVGAGRQRGSSRRARRRSARGRRARVAARLRGAHVARRHAGAAHPPHPAQRAAHGGGDGPRHHRHAGAAASSRDVGPTRRASSPPTCSSRGSGCASSSWSPTAGRTSARSRRCAIRSPRRCVGRAARRLGAPARRAARATSTTSGQRGDVELEGDPELQQAVRFALFQVLSAGARAEGRAIPAKGLTGTGYDGHSFWDTELYIVPVLDLHRARRPPRTRCAGATRRCRRREARARDLGLAGAAFPWRTIHGEECSGYWPAGTAAFHVNADIAVAVHPLRAAPPATTPSSATSASTSSSRRRGCGARSATTTRRQLPHRRRHRPRRVQRHRRQQRLHEPDGAAEPASAPPTPASATRTGRASSGVTPEEMAAWRAAAERVVIPYDEKLGVHQQSEGFTAARAVGLRRDAAGPVSAAAALPVLRSLSQAGGQAARPRAGDAAVQRRLHARAAGAQLRLLRAHHRPRLVAVGVHRGGGGGRRRPPAARVRLRRRGGADGPARPASTTRATGCTSRRWPAPGSRSSSASAACATTATRSRSRRGCPTG